MNELVHGEWVGVGLSSKTASLVCACWLFSVPVGFGAHVFGAYLVASVPVGFDACWLRCLLASVHVGFDAWWHRCLLALVPVWHRYLCGFGAGQLRCPCGFGAWWLRCPCGFDARVASVLGGPHRWLRSPGVYFPLHPWMGLGRAQLKEQWLSQLLSTPHPWSCDISRQITCTVRVRSDTLNLIHSAHCMAVHTTMPINLCGHHFVMSAPAAGGDSPVHCDRWQSSVRPLVHRCRGNYRFFHAVIILLLLPALCHRHNASSGLSKHASSVRRRGLGQGHIPLP